MVGKYGEKVEKILVFSVSKRITVIFGKAIRFDTERDGNLAFENGLADLARSQSYSLVHAELSSMVCR